LLKKYSIPAEDFFAKLKSEEFKDKAHYEFALCKHLQVTGFPQVLIQQGDRKFYLITKGFSDYNVMKERIDNVLKEING
jgi:putative protein-disulfide isomerase